jgi:hypothetical protein
VPPARPKTAKKKPGGARRGAGKPPFKPTDADRTTVTIMVATGLKQEDIAACLGERGIDPVTLRKHFKRELNIGVAKVNGICGVGIVRAMQAGESWALRYWAGARMGWNDRSPRPGEDTGPGMLWDEFVELYRRRAGHATDE